MLKLCSMNKCDKLQIFEKWQHLFFSFDKSEHVKKVAFGYLKEHAEVTSDNDFAKVLQLHRSLLHYHNPKSSDRDCFGRGAIDRCSNLLYCGHSAMLLNSSFATRTCSDPILVWLRSWQAALHAMRARLVRWCSCFAVGGDPGSYWRSCCSICSKPSRAGSRDPSLAETSSRTRLFSFTGGYATSTFYGCSYAAPAVRSTTPTHARTWYDQHSII